MKFKSSLLIAIAIAVACTFVSQSAQARKSGTMPEDNSNGSLVDDHGGLNNSTNSTSNSGSGKNKGNAKNNVEIKIKLVTAPEFAPAKGTARFRDRANGKKQDIQVEVQVSKSLAGTVYGVTIGDTVIGTVTINALGKGKLELSTERGDVVPAVTAGTLVGVLTETGAIVLAGSF